jgi:mandelamide amidase
VPKIDAPAIARLRSAGAEIVGKTNMHELAYGITSNNAAFGPVRNAFDATCFAGGSSGRQG